MRSRTVFARSGGVCAILVGVVAGAVSGGEVYQQFRAASWPSTGGVVLEAKVVETLRGRRSRPATAPFIRYTYQVAGTHHISTRITIVPSRFAVGQAAHQVLSKYAGPSVTVYYDPADPSNSVLDHSFDPGALLVPAACVLLVIGGVAAFRWSKRPGTRTVPGDQA